MRYTIYRVNNQLNGKFYIGKHQTLNPDDRYFGSGKALLDAIKLHGKENFTKEILFEFDTEEEMNTKERELVTEDLVANPKSYNMAVGGEGGPHFKGRSHSEETKAQISATNTGKQKTFSPEFYENKNKFEKGNELWKNRNYQHSEESKEKIRQANLGKESKLKGRKMSEEQKEKIRQTLLRRNGNMPV